ncbi:competence type IV pilus major pilin ComGC [uncultured Mitsuokella sp.]|uniref:competence type IV pilus major pilin ComGC n=1 Tax=uncultured Mitsuokella sp. TaxID=453120 RepID=UPI0026703EE2|nr:prepilin-type N-terminal cleavage/methylation domain-containing protein [uncultured Mitsuokella sp.]
MRTKEMRTNEAGFTLIGMLIAVGIVAILAMIAVPKFTSAIASANTAKIQSDLSTLDTAIAVYEIEHGEPPNEIEQLEDYLRDTNVTPPKGKCYMDGVPHDIQSEAYTISKGRALCDNKTVTAFYKSKEKKADSSSEVDGDSSGSVQN